MMDVQLSPQVSDEPQLIDRRYHCVLYLKRENDGTFSLNEQHVQGFSQALNVALALITDPTTEWVYTL